MKWMEEYAPITFERCTDKNCSDEELMKKTIGEKLREDQNLIQQQQKADRNFKIFLGVMSVIFIIWTIKTIN